MNGSIIWRSIRKTVGVTVCAGALCALPAMVYGQENPNGMNPDRNGMSAATTEPSRLMFPPGIQQTPSDTQAASNDIKAELVKVVDRATSKGQYSQLMAELNKSSRDRAEQFKDVDQKSLDRSIDAIRTAWRNKYGEDFNVNSSNLSFDENYRLLVGEVQDPVTAATNWPVPAANNGAQQASERMAPNANAPMGDETMAKNAGLEKGRGVALMCLPASEHGDAVTISWVHELIGGWTIDLPTNRSGEQIYNDLSSRMSYIGLHADSLPATPHEGYQMLTREIVASMYGVQPESAHASAR